MRAPVSLSVACLLLPACGPGADAPPLAPEADVLAALTAADADADQRAALVEVGRLAAPPGTPLQTRREALIRALALYAHG